GDENINTDFFFVRVSGIAVDSNGVAAITGVTESTVLTLQNAAQASYGGGNTDAYIAAFSADGGTLVYGSFLGGSGDEDLFGGGIAVDPSGAWYLTGDTQSDNFPTTASAFQPARQGVFDAYVTKIDRSLVGAATLAYSSYFGGTGNDGGEGIAADLLGNVYV